MTEQQTMVTGLGERHIIHTVITDFGVVTTECEPYLRWMNYDDSVKPTSDCSRCFPDRSRG